MGFWGAWLTAPLFVAAAASGQRIVAPMQLPPGVAALAVEFWFPHLLAGPAGVALWALGSFFNGSATRASRCCLWARWQ